MVLTTLVLCPAPHRFQTSYGLASLDQFQARSG